MSDDEILREHGELLWEAYVAFATQPAYFTAMCDHVNKAEFKRDRWHEAMDRRTAENRAAEDESPTCR